MINKNPGARRPALSRLVAASALGAVFVASASLSARADAALADLVEEVAPSVVTVLASQSAKAEHTRVDKFDFEGHPFGEFFKRFGAPEGMPMPHQGPKQGLGSGFVMDEDGLIVTNHHVIDGADKITVRLSDDREFQAELVGADPLTDIAVLRIGADGPLPAVELGDSDAIRVGEDVVAVGNPFGLSSTVTTGIVSAKGRNISEGPYAEFIQTDAAINRGNSGGPLFNMEGDVVGVNSAIYSPTGGSVGLGFAVTSNIVEDIVADLVDDGQVDRGWLGVSIQGISPDIAAAMGLENSSGALVSDVVDGSPADGVLKTGDIITGFDGTKVKSSADLPRLVGATETGSKASIDVLRNGDPETLIVTIGTHEATARMTVNEADPAPDARLGVTVAPVKEAAQAGLKVDPGATGVVITDLDPQSPAAEAGLRKGDVIVKFGKTEIDSPQSLKAALGSEDTDPALMLINRDGNQLFVTVRIA